MKAAVVPSICGRWEDCDVPTTNPDVNQTLNKIRTSGLCYSDGHLNQDRISTELSRILENETASDHVTSGQPAASCRVKFWARITNE